MSPKLSFLFLCVLAAASFMFVGCEADPEGDVVDGNTGTNNPGTNNPSTNNPVDTLKYFFVKIDDFSSNNTGDASGADIDGVKLVKAGIEHFPKTVEDYSPGVNADGIDADALNASNALSVDSVSADGSNCNIDTTTFVSLGGVGGHLVLGFDTAIEEGDELFVYEIGNCEFDGGTAKPDPLTVSVSVAADPDGTWTKIFASSDLVDTIVGGAVPALPVVTK